MIIFFTIPITVRLVQQKQVVQQAQVGRAVLEIVPTRQTLTKGERGTFEVLLNPNRERVRLIRILLSYDPQFLEIEKVSIGDVFEKMLDISEMALINTRNFSTPGTINYEISFSHGSSKYLSEVASVAKVYFTALKSGFSNVTFLTSNQPPTSALINESGDDVLNRGFGATIKINPAPL